jgi:YVTN family beta-propeller protein
MTSQRLLVPAPLKRYAAALLRLVMLTGTAAQGAPFAYIPNYGANSVSVLDTATNTVTATVAVGRQPYGVAANSAGTRVYVSNADQNTISVLDTATNSVIASVAVGQLPLGVAVNAAGTRVYAANAQAASVSVIDTATNAAIATVAVGSNPHGVAVNLAGTRVYVTNEGAGSVSVIDTGSNVVVASVPVSASPRGIAVNTAGTRVYVAHYTSFGTASVSVIDTQTNTVIASAQVLGSSVGLALNPAGTLLYVTNNRSPNTVVEVIDTRCNAVVASVPLAPNASGVRPFASGIAVNPTGTLVYVTTFTQAGSMVVDNNVRVIDTATNTVVATIPVGNSPQAFGVFISPGAVVPPPPPVPPAPIRVTGIEVTQGIQDLAGSVPTVSGKRTFVRVHVVSDGPAIAGVTASLSGIGSFISGGTPVHVPLGPLVPSNTGGPRLTVRPDPKRSIIDDSFLFELPWRWTNFSGLRLHATLSQPAGPPVASCASDVVAAPVFEFRTFTLLNVAFVRMGYQLPGVADPAAALAQTSLLEQRQTESWLRRTYPLSELNTGPDFALFDGALGSWVDQSDVSCQTMHAPADRNLCAYTYTSLRLASQYVKTGGLFGLFNNGLIDRFDVVYGLIPQHPAGPFTRGACCKLGVGAGPANDVTYAAHEIGHFLGRNHPVEGSSACGHSPDDPNYPYFLSFIAPPLSDPNTAMAGFDGGDANLAIPMRFLPPRTSYDVMGYCQPTTWISDYTYNGLLTRLRALHPFNVTAVGASAPVANAGAGTPQVGDWLAVFGQIRPETATAGIVEIQRIDRVFSVPPRLPGNYSIRLLGDGVVTLADYPFAPTTTADAPQPGFGHVVPFVAGTRQVQIVDTAAGGAVLASKAVSSNAPTIVNVAPQAAPDPMTGLMTLGWTASDADGDTLTFEVFYTRDDGVSLQALMLGVSAASVQIDTSQFGGGIARFRVVASDGLQTSHADSPPITLANRPPRPRILTPADGTRVYLGQVVNLDGEAKDPKDGVIADTGLAWSSQQGPLGTGAKISLANLAVGFHLLSLTATNSDGLTATRSVGITVDGNLDPQGPTLTAGPGQIGWHVSVGETQVQSAELDIGNRGSGNLQFTVSSSAAWLAASMSTAMAPTTITLFANPSGFADGSSTDTSVTLTAVGIPGQTITIPVRLAVGNTFDAGNHSPPAIVDPIYRSGFE